MPAFVCAVVIYVQNRTENVTWVTNGDSRLSLFLKYNTDMSADIFCLVCKGSTALHCQLSSNYNASLTNMTLREATD